MDRTTLFLKLAVLIILPISLFYLSGCASTQTEQGTDWEPWNGELTGMIDADLKMLFSRIEEQKDVYLVKGIFEGDIGRVSGGYGSGTMNGKIEGKVKDGIFTVRMWGHARVDEGSAAIGGEMIGTLSKTQAFGTWTINARDDEDSYKFTGEWSAKKIDSVSKGN
jgi:hypothetical protein